MSDVLINSDGSPCVVLLLSVRFGTPLVDEVNTIEEAMGVAEAHVDFNSASPFGITVDGDLVRVANGKGSEEILEIDFAAMGWTMPTALDWLYAHENGFDVELPQWVLDWVAEVRRERREQRSRPGSGAGRDWMSAFGFRFDS